MLTCHVNQRENELIDGTSPSGGPNEVGREAAVHHRAGRRARNGVCNLLNKVRIHSYGYSNLNLIHALWRNTSGNGSP